MSSVAVILFDQLPLPADCDVPCPALDTLELESACFEQFHSQDLRDAATIADWLGGDAAVAGFGEMLRSQGVSVSQLVLDESDSNSTRSERRSVSESHAALNMIDLPACLASDSVPPRDGGVTGSTAGANALTWITVRGQEMSATIVDQLLHRAYESVSSETTLIVTSRARQCAGATEPFTSDSGAHRSRVPLWIRTTDRRACRVQTQCGSHDLLPTIQTILYPESGASTAPKISLIDFVHDPNLGLTRVIPIRADLWTAMRSAEFLLVTEQRSNTDEGPDNSDEPQQRLFRLPEDLWHVHDMISTFPEVAEMLALKE